MQVGAPRWAGPALSVVSLVSGYVLFWPRPAVSGGVAGGDKLVHLLLFATLAALAAARFGARAAVLAAVLGYAALSELIQGLFLPERSGDPLDLLADTVGLLLGMAVARRWLVAGPGSGRS